MKQNNEVSSTERKGSDNLYLRNLERIEKRRKLLKERNATFLFDGLLQKLPAYKDVLMGFTRGDIILITAQTGVGKSKFMRWLVKLLKEEASRREVPIKFFYNSLEESEEKIAASHALTKLAFEGAPMHLYDVLQFANKDTIISDEQFALVQKVYRELAHSQGNMLEVLAEHNPFGLFKRVRQYLYEHGKFLDEHGNPMIIEKGKPFPQWKSYQPDDPNRLVVTITDTVDKMVSTKGKTLYESVHYFASTYLDAILSQRCGCLNIIVQQQIPISDRPTYYKGEKMIDPLLPTLETLRTCKATRESATIAFGLFNPADNRLDEYLGYDVAKTRNLLRGLLLLKSRNGEGDSIELPVILNPFTDNFVQGTPGNPEYDYHKIRRWYEAAGR